MAALVLVVPPLGAERLQAPRLGVGQSQPAVDVPAALVEGLLGRVESRGPECARELDDSRARPRFGWSRIVWTARVDDVIMGGMRDRWVERLGVR